MITNADDDFYERVTSRIFVVMLAIAGAGTLVAPGVARLERGRWIRARARPSRGSISGG